jgi:hypothetical protein
MSFVGKLISGEKFTIEEALLNVSTKFIMCEEARRTGTVSFKFSDYVRVAYEQIYEEYGIEMDLGLDRIGELHLE